MWTLTKSRKSQEAAVTISQCCGTRYHDGEELEVCVRLRTVVNVRLTTHRAHHVADITLAYDNFEMMLQAVTAYVALATRRVQHLTATQTTVQINLAKGHITHRHHHECTPDWSVAVFTNCLHAQRPHHSSQFTSCHLQ